MAWNDTPKEYLEAMLIGLVRLTHSDTFKEALDYHFQLLDEISEERYDGNKAQASRNSPELIQSWNDVQCERFAIMRTMLIDKFGDEGNKVMNAFESGAYDEEWKAQYEFNV